MIAIAEKRSAPSMPRPRRPASSAGSPASRSALVMVIAPWNYPFLTAVNSIVPALMAGNAVILKHASADAAGRRALRRGVQARPGCRTGSFQNLVLNHADTEKLIGSGQIDHINFTGSVEGGRRIERAAAGTFATLGLELGGKDPAYVRADANLDHAVENLVDGAFFNSGQSCCGVERIYVHATDLRRLRRGLRRELPRAVTLGNPLDPGHRRSARWRAPSFADLVREQTAEANAQGRQAARSTRTISTSARLALSGAGGAGRTSTTRWR